MDTTNKTTKNNVIAERRAFISYLKSESFTKKSLFYSNYPDHQLIYAGALVAKYTDVSIELKAQKKDIDEVLTNNFNRYLQELEDSRVTPIKLDMNVLIAFQNENKIDDREYNLLINWKGLTFSFDFDYFLAIAKTYVNPHVRPFHIIGTDGARYSLSICLAIMGDNGVGFLMPNSEELNEIREIKPISFEPFESEYPEGSKLRLIDFISHGYHVTTRNRQIIDNELARRAENERIKNIEHSISYSFEE
jgi:hypothetical protein